jgi:para-nitrobenzyl esterase
MPTGAYHTSDVQYLFHVSNLPGPQSEAQRALSLEMMRYWAAFAASLRPSASGAPEWPAFTPARPAILALRPGGSRLIGDFRADHHCDFWRPAPAAGTGPAGRKEPAGKQEEKKAR